MADPPVVLVGAASRERAIWPRLNNRGNAFPRETPHLITQHTNGQWHFSTAAGRGLFGLMVIAVAQ